MKKSKPFLLSPYIANEYQNSITKRVREMNEDLLKVLKLYLTFSESDGLQLSPIAIEESTRAKNELTEDSYFSFNNIFDFFFRGWKKRFERLAKIRAKNVTAKIEESVDRQIQNEFKKVGFVVNFTNTPTINNLLHNAYSNNISLITSIPEKLHEDIKDILKKGIENNTSLKDISDSIQKRGGVTERRAKFITRDQVHKIHNDVSLARSKEAGIEYGFWFHRSGSKQPRKTHKRTKAQGGMNGERFKLSEGCYDPDIKVSRKIQPGELYNCHCTYRADLSSFNPSIVAQDSVLIMRKGKKVLNKNINKSVYYN